MMKQRTNSCFNPGAFNVNWLSQRPTFAFRVSVNFYEEKGITATCLKKRNAYNAFLILP